MAELIFYFSHLNIHYRTDTVVVHHLVARGTVDKDVMYVLKNMETGQNVRLEAVKARIRKDYREVSSCRIVLLIETGSVETGSAVFCR